MACRFSFGVPSMCESSRAARLICRQLLARKRHLCKGWVRTGKLERKVGVRRIGWIVAFMGLLAGPDDDRAFAQQAAAPGTKRTTITSKASLEGDGSGALKNGEAQLHLVQHLS